MLKVGNLHWLIGLLVLFASQSSFAISRYICSDALTTDHGVQAAMNSFRDRQESQLLVHAMKPRALTPVEVDAFIDFFYGIPILITFRDGKSQEFKSDKRSIVNFFERLRTNLISSVDYPPESTAMIGKMLLEACLLVRSDDSGCGIYRNYQVTSSPEMRPFTTTQEQILKWLALSATPHNLLVTSYQGMSSREVADHLNSFARGQMALALKMLKAAFTEDESDILFAEFVRPKIVQGAVNFAITVNTMRH